MGIPFIYRLYITCGKLQNLSEHNLSRDFIFEVRMSFQFHATVLESINKAYIILRKLSSYAVSGNRTEEACTYRITEPNRFSLWWLHSMNLDSFTQLHFLFLFLKKKKFKFFSKLVLKKFSSTHYLMVEMTIYMNFNFSPMTFLMSHVDCLLNWQSISGLKEIS